MEFEASEPVAQPIYSTVNPEVKVVRNSPEVLGGWKGCHERPQLASEVVVTTHQVSDEGLGKNGRGDF